MLVRSLPMKSRKRLARGARLSHVRNAFMTSQTFSKLQRAQPCFRDFETSISDKTRPKLDLKPAVSGKNNNNNNNKKPFLSLGPVMFHFKSPLNWCRMLFFHFIIIIIFFFFFEKKSNGNILSENWVGVCVCVGGGGGIKSLDHHVAVTFPWIRIRCGVLFRVISPLRHVITKDRKAKETALESLHESFRL